MEAGITQEPAQQELRLWTVGQIGLASYLAGPLGGCYCLGKNYTALGRPDYAKRCYGIGLMGIILVVTILALMPDELMQAIPAFAIVAAYLGGIVGFARAYQSSDLKEKLNGSARRYSYFWCILVMASLCIVQTPLIFIYSFVLGYFF